MALRLCSGTVAAHAAAIIGKRGLVVPHPLGPTRAKQQPGGTPPPHLAPLQALHAGGHVHAGLDVVQQAQRVGQHEVTLVLRHHLARLRVQPTSRRLQRAPQRLQLHRGPGRGLCVQGGGGLGVKRLLARWHIDQRGPSPAFAER